MQDFEDPHSQSPSLSGYDLVAEEWQETNWDGEGVVVDLVAMHVHELQDAKK